MVFLRVFFHLFLSVVLDLVYVSAVQQVYEAERCRKLHDTYRAIQKLYNKIGQLD